LLIGDEPWIQATSEMQPEADNWAFSALGLGGPRCVIFSSSLNLRSGLLATGRLRDDDP